VVVRIEKRSTRQLTLAARRVLRAEVACFSRGRS